MKQSKRNIGFATFPEFSKLIPEDRKLYQSKIADYPPIGDIQFAGLMTWWDSLNGVLISELNENLVIQFWRPGNEKRSGLSLIGRNNIDESICMILDYLQQTGEPTRLVNVPEFTLAEIRHHELFSIKEEPWYDEYIVEASRFYPLSNLSTIRRKRIERLVEKFGRENLHARSLDLSIAENKEFLIAVAEKWMRKNINSSGKVGMEALKVNIDFIEEFGTSNVCIYSGNELLGFCLYDTTPDKSHIILAHTQATHRDTLGFELISYMISEWFDRRGYVYANIGADGGDLRLRMFMKTLGPCNYFRKYTVKPVGG